MRLAATHTLVLALALGAFAAPASAQLSAKEAQQVLQATAKYIETGQHERAVEELGRANDIRATKMLIKLFKDWTDRGVDKHNRDVDVFGLRQRMVNALMLIEDDLSWKYLLGQLTDRKLGEFDKLWIKFAIVEALGKKPQAHCLDKLLQVVRHKRVDVRVMGAYGLFNRYGDRNAIDAMWLAFEDESWQVRYMGLLGLLKGRAQLGQERYFTRVERAEKGSRERADLLRGLRTMIVKGDWEIEQWREWAGSLDAKQLTMYRGNHRRFVADRGDLIGRREHQEILAHERKPFPGGTCFGIKLRTKRLAIVVDSHQELGQQPALNLPVGTNVVPGKEMTLREAMLEEVALAIEKLPGDTEVALYSCDRGAQPISAKMQPLSDDGYRERLTKALRGRGAKASSNLYRAFERIYSMHSRDPLAEKNFEEGPDTVLLLTRGLPEMGKIAYRKVVLRNKRPWHLEFVNAWEQVMLARQVRWHVVGLGKYHEATLLRTLAQRTGGQFVSIGR